MKLKLFITGLLLIFAVSLTHLPAQANSKAPVDVLIRVNGNLNIRNHEGTPAEIKELLQNEAERTQRDLIDFLQNVNKTESVEYKSIWIINAIKLRATSDVIRMLNDRPDVMEIIPDEIISLPPSIPGEEIKSEGEALWNINMVNAPDVWAKYNLRGQNVKIGHIDSGADGNHPDLKGKIYAWKDFSGTETSPVDGNGHGTHSLGTIIGGNASGQYIGVAPEATVAVARVFSASGSTSSSAIMEAMQWIMDPDNNPSTDDTPKVVSNSWGASGQNTTYWDAVDAWVQAGIFPCFAAGNSGPGASTMGSPGAFPHSFAVGATDSGDKIASFSSRGPVTWEGVKMVKPDVSAPGKNIRSAITGGGYGNKSGTSMACPNVAGAITLLYQAEPGLDIATITKILEETAVELGEDGKDNVFGSGRIDILKAVGRVLLGGKLQGTITTADGVPLKGAKIKIKNVVELKTDATGNFKTILNDGEYKVEISAFAYLPVTKTVKITKKETTDLTVSLKKSPTVVLSGTILESNSGDPLAATISLIDSPASPVTTDPKTGKFVLTIPAGNYTVKVSSFQHKTVTKDIELGENGSSLTIEMEKLPPVLLIADSKTDYTKYYVDAIKKAGKKYTLLETAEGVTSDLLVQYPMVVWFTGKDSSKTLTDNDQAFLTAYLKSGGNLFLSGQDIGYSIKNTEFFKTMIKAKYVQDSSKVKEIKGLDMFQGTNFSIAGGTGANNQSYPDVVEEISPAKLIFNYENDTNNAGGAGIVLDEKTYRVVYLGFGFEGVADEVYRNKIMKNILDFLLPQGKIKFVRAIAIDSIMSKEKLEYNNSGAVYAERLIIQINEEIEEGNSKMLHLFIEEFESNKNSNILQYIGSKTRDILMSNNGENFKSELEKINSLLK